MKLNDFKPALTGEAPAPPVSGLLAQQVSPSSPVETPHGAAEAPQEEQYFTSITPSGIEVAYSPAPRRHYKLRNNATWSSSTPSVEVPSVTNVLGVLDKSGPLTWWSQGNACEGIIELVKREQLGTFDRWGVHRNALVQYGEVRTLATKESLVDLLVEHKLSCNHTKDKAADRGVNVHDAFEQWCKTGFVPSAKDFPETEREYINGLNQFVCAVEGTVLDAESELMVGSLEHSYAGRFDLVLTLSKPVEVVTKTYPKRKPRIEEIPAGRYLLDLKTSKGIYNTHYLQLEAYEAAAVECGYEPTDHRGVIHVTADGRYELVLNKDWTFEDFLSVRACYQTMNERGVVQALRDELDAKEVA